MAGETHTQCCLVRDGAELVSWIPSKFAGDATFQLCGKVCRWRLR